MFRASLTNNRRRPKISEPNSNPSLRAKRSNPGAAHRRPLGCFVARAPRNDGWGHADPIHSIVIGRRLWIPPGCAIISTFCDFSTLCRGENFPSVSSSDEFTGSAQRKRRDDARRRRFTRGGIRVGAKRPGGVELARVQHLHDDLSNAAIRAARRAQYAPPATRSSVSSRLAADNPQSRRPARGATSGLTSGAFVGRDLQHDRPSRFPGAERDDLRLYHDFVLSERKKLQ